MRRTLLALLLIIFLIVSCKLKESVTDPGDTTDAELIIEFPNGSDSLMVGSTYDVLWSSTIKSNLVLEYSTDNGSVWSSISDSVANTGLYTWGPIPSSKSARCLMRIRTEDGASSDESDSTWSIIENTSKVLILTSPTGGEVVEQGGSLVIDWISSLVTSVLIEFSGDNGITWETVVTNYDATKGSYTWQEIPILSSTQCLIRISDVASPSISDVMTSNFTIQIDKNLLIISPNGGESIEGGTEYEVRWYSKEVSTVNLEYSINNGIDWNSIAKDITNTGIYYWNPVPAAPSTLAKLRITDTNNSSNVDVSDTTFSIMPEGAISISSPISTSKWLSGTKQFINWTSKNVANVKIEYSTNNGSGWQVITESTLSDGSFEWDPIPAHNSSLCNIRISDASDGHPSTIMSTPFTIYTGEEILEVYTPNGGESWEAGSEQEITWFAEGIDNIKIELTTNNGQSWSTLESSYPNVGTYTLSFVPVTPSSLCKIRLSDAVDSSPSDLSNKNFSIVAEKKVIVQSPNGGEQLVVGAQSEIKWFSTDVASVNIEYTVNNGLDWTVIESNLTNTGVYQWNPVPNTPSNLARIRITDTDNSANTDQSDGTFSITKESQFAVISPNGGEVFEVGTQAEIKWSANDVASVKIEYTINNGLDWTVITNSIPNTGLYYWEPVPKTPSNLAKIRITDTVNSENFDESDGTFTISQESQIAVLEPNGGEQLQAGTTTNIRWTSANVGNVKIEYTTNNGAAWNVITENTPSVGFFIWEGLPDISSQQCRVKVSDADDGIPSDVSDANFTITNQVVEVLTITSPNGGEEWQSGVSQLITWQSSGVDSVKIEYSLNNGTSWTTIENSIENADAYSWNPVPNVDDFKRASKIRISDAEDGKPVDESNGTFTIKPIPSITLIAPNGGEEYEFGETVTFSWQSIGVERVAILATSNNGAVWDTLEASVLNTGIYNKGFSKASSEYKVQIRDAVTGSPSDESDGTFTVLPQIVKKITVTRPNGGENWLTSNGGNTNYHEIKWTSENVSNVDVQYTLDGGANWFDIATGVVSNGLYNWAVPESIQFRTDNALIRIKDASNENLFDQSDDFFTIHPQTKLLRLEQPAGDEFFLCTNDIPDMLNTIIWESAGISHVKIEYSFNNGATWTVLESLYESSGAYGIDPEDLGQYVYDLDSNLVYIADNPSSQARIRLTDVTPTGIPYVPAADPTIVDVSEQFNLGICTAAIKEFEPSNDALGKKKNK